MSRNYNALCQEKGSTKVNELEMSKNKANKAKGMSKPKKMGAIKVMSTRG